TPESRSICTKDLSLVSAHVGAICLGYRATTTFRSRISDRLSDRAVCAAVLAHRAGVVLSICGVCLDPGVGGQNSCSLSLAWVLTKFCEKILDAITTRATSSDRG